MNKIYKTFHSGRHVFFLMIFICIIIGAAVLKIAASVILPFVVAVLLSLVMYPMIKGLDKIRCPRLISILLIIVIIVSGIFIFGVVLFTSGMMIVEQLPQYEGSIKVLYVWAADIFNLPNDDAQTIWQNLWDQGAIRTFVRDFTIFISNISFRLVSSAVLAVLFMVFILLEASYFKEKLTTAFENRVGNLNRIGNDLINQVTRYLTAKFLFSLANGIIYFIGFSFIGLEFAIVWGVLQFLLNFIPTLGSIAAGVVISLFALMQFWPEPGPVIAVVAVILSVNLVLSNILDPKLVGEHVGISPLVVLVSLSIWGYIWGFTGMLLAVPMTVIIKIVCENIPIMEPVSILLGSRKAVLAKKAEQEKYAAETADDDSQS